MHLDTAHTHIVSSIIHVANDLAPGEKWPLYIYAHDGTLHKVDFEPGDAVLYVTFFKNNAASAGHRSAVAAYMLRLHC